MSMDVLAHLHRSMFGYVLSYIFILLWEEMKIGRIIQNSYSLRFILSVTIV